MQDNTWLIISAPIVGLIGYYLRIAWQERQKAKLTPATIQLIQAVITQRACVICGQEGHEYGHFQSGSRRSIFLNARSQQESQVLCRRCKNCGNVQMYARFQGQVDTGTHKSV